MRIPVFILMMLPALLSTGQELSEALPRPVLRLLKNSFAQKSIELTDLSSEVATLPGDHFLLIHQGEPSEPDGYLHMGRVKTCRAGGCSSPGLVAPGEESEYFDYAIIFNPDLRVDAVQIYNYQASHGHGIAAAGWLRQFEGFSSGKRLEVGKNIDAISGATISVLAITNDIELKTNQLKEAITHK
jgi:hypothetical protein